MVVLGAGGAVPAPRVMAWDGSAVLLPAWGAPWAEPERLPALDAAGVQHDRLLLPPGASVEAADVGPFLPQGVAAAVLEAANVAVEVVADSSPAAVEDLVDSQAPPNNQAASGNAHCATPIHRRPKYVLEMGPP